MESSTSATSLRLKSTWTISPSHKPRADAKWFEVLSGRSGYGGRHDAAPTCSTAPLMYWKQRSAARQ